MRFAVSPPYWKTWWFILLSVLVGGGLVAVVVLNRVRHLLAIEKLRTKIAADLHDDIGAGLTEISITSEVISRKLPQPAGDAVSGDLERIGDASRRLIASMSDIVWLVNPKRDSLHDLIARLGDVYKEPATASGVTMRVENIEAVKNVRLRIKHRQHVFLIFKEAIHNALKHSGCSEITLDVVTASGRIEIRLSDNGGGFDADSESPGNGLGNMSERAARIKARLGIDSRPGRGTAVSLSIRL